MADPRLALADQYTELAAFNLAESQKINRWRENRIATLTRQGQIAYATRPTTIHDPESIKWSLAQKDPKLDEYGAGIAITERRASMYSQMAADLRLAVLTELMALHAAI